jgi:hypothetical protein
MPTIEQARDNSRIKPVYLVEIDLLNSGPTLYFSDRIISVGGQAYEPFIDMITGLSQALERSSAQFTNSAISIKFKNDPYINSGTPFAFLSLLGDTYPFQGASLTLKRTYLDDDNSPSDVETVFVGVLDPPMDINLVEFVCSVSSAELEADKSY